MWYSNSPNDICKKKFKKKTMVAKFNTWLRFRITKNKNKIIN